MDTYLWLMRGAANEKFDRHVFACVLAVALADPLRQPAAALGLATVQLADLVGAYFPHASGVAEGDGSACLAPEEADLRLLLAEHGSRGAPEEAWLAAIIARRALEPNHLWQDLGLTGRADLGRLMRRHFAPLAVLNDRDMKWKKFFYREMCRREDVPVCKSPVCNSCSDFGLCFGAEDGPSLIPHAATRPIIGGSPC